MNSFESDTKTMHCFYILYLRFNLSFYRKPTPVTVLCLMIEQLHE